MFGGFRRGSVNDFKIAIIMAVSYFVLFTVGSCLLFARRSLIKKQAFDGKTLLRTNDIKKSFGKKRVLSDVNLEIKKGEMNGLVGNNGAGKTTLLKMFCNLLRPTGGTITLNEQAFASSVPIGALIENPALYFDMTAYQNLKAKAIALNVKYSQKDIYDLLKIVDLQDTGKKDVRKFSMGMKQRLGIAMALVGDPDLLILDEPINGLDPQGIIEIRSILERLHRERNVTMIISSHILDELAKTATRFCVINHGEIIKNCTKQQFMTECKGKDIAEYYLQLIHTA